MTDQDVTGEMTRDFAEDRKYLNRTTTGVGGGLAAMIPVVAGIASLTEPSSIPLVLMGGGVAVAALLTHGWQWQKSIRRHGYQSVID